MTNICVARGCGKEFVPRRSGTQQIYCCYKCRRRGMHAQEKNVSPKNELLYSARARAKSEGVPCTITLQDFDIPERCPILDIPLKRGEGKATPNSPSLDKHIPERGYVPGNVQVISFLANTMKGRLTSPEPFQRMAEYLSKRPAV